MRVKEFFKLFGIGAGIGVSMIIPGVSGGTVAVMFGIYEKLINAVSNLRREFKASALYLLPVFLGAVVAVAAMYFPIRYALEYVPLPTVLLFTGLMAGSVPKLVGDGLRNGFCKYNVLSVVLPLAVVVGICFIPSIGDVDLGANMPAYGYALLVLIGMLASCALVVPGISGSMLLLIFGYYKPILDAVSGIATAFGHSAAVLLLFALGIALGLFGIVRLMKLLLSKFPRGTHWAIVGFVAGSVPAVLITFDYAAAPLGAAQIAIGVLLCAAGFALAFILTMAAEKSARAATESERVQ